MLDIDASELSFENLRLHYFTERSDIRLFKGKRERKYISYASTALGEIELSEWCNLSRQLIERSGEQQLQAQLYDWVSEHTFGNSSEKEMRRESLELHMSRIFDNPEWVGYVEFNGQYRPDVLNQTELGWVKTSCCDRPCMTTATQIKRAKFREDRIFCPICGRLSEFENCASP